MMEEINFRHQYPPKGFIKWSAPAKPGQKYMYDPFEDEYLWYNPETKKTGCYIQKKMCNGSWVNVHGGLIATIADSNMFVAATDFLPGPCVTVQLNITYVSGAQMNQWIEAEGRVTKNTKSLVFVTGRVFVPDTTEIIATYTGIIKKIKANGHPSSSNL